MPKKFQSDKEVPDLCPPELLLPNDSNYLTRAKPDAEGTVSPVELSWLMFNDELPRISGWHFVRFNLETAVRFDDVERVHREIRASDYMSHNMRVVTRLALDPRRYETFDFAKAYDLEKGKEFPKYDERVYFEAFHDTFGVVDRPHLTSEEA